VRDFTSEQCTSILKRVPPGTSQSPDAASASLPERRGARTRQARPSRNVAEPGRGKRVPPGTPRSPDAASASLPERRGARTRQARPSRNAAEPGRGKRVPPGSPQNPDATSASLPDRRSAAKSRPFREGRACPVRNRPHGTAFRRAWISAASFAHATRHGHSPARPRGNKGRGLRRAPCLAFSGITRDAVAYLVSAAFMNLAVSAVTVMTALPSANARFEVS